MKSFARVQLCVALCAIGCRQRDYNVAGDTASAAASGITTAKARVEARVQALRAHPYYRQGAEPYLLVHGEDSETKGTVILFHGFSGAPGQMAPLADFIFEAGFDVYSANVAGHGLVNQDKQGVPLEQRAVHWPVTRVNRRHAEFEQTLKKHGWDEKLRNMDPSQVGEFLKGEAVKSPGAALGVARLALEFRQIERASTSPSEDEFRDWFDSSHMDYLKAAKEAYEDVRTLRGPFHTVGLSAGATMALALGGEYPEVFKSVVAFTPLIEVGHKDPQKAEDARKGVRNIGPIASVAPWFGWPPKPMFPLGAFTALDKFGRSHVAQPPVIKKYRGEGGRPHPNAFIVTTHHEDAADTAATRRFFDAIGGTTLGHAYFQYEERQYVPHPVCDITARSQGMINMYYKTLYQETARFLLTGKVRLGRLQFQDLDDTLPGKAPVGPDEGIGIPAHVNLHGIQ